MCSRRPRALGAVALVGSILPIIAWGAGKGARTSVSLDGTWRFKPLVVAEERVGGKWHGARELPWAEVCVPSMWREGLSRPAPGLPDEWVNCHKARYRRTFRVPLDWRGRRIFVKFEGVASLAEVRVNGQAAGVHLGGWTPFEVDITPFVKFGAENEIEVEVTDFTCALEGDFKAGEGLPEGSLLSPEPLFAGIWGSVALEARPPVYVEEVYIAPEAGEGRAEARIRVRNKLKRPVSVEVLCRALDGRWEAGRFEPRTVTIGAGEAVTLLLRGRIAPERRWEPSKPRLLDAEATLLDPGTREVLDRVLVPFGYRRFVAAGPRLLLDGKPILLRGAEVSPLDLPYGSEPELMRAFGAFRRALGLDALYLGGGVHPERVIEAADRAGFLLLDGSMLRGRHLAWSREEFLRNALRQVEEWVRRDRNHPSVVAWVVERRSLKFEGAERVLLEAVKLIRRLDPTRPIIFWEDLCGLGGEADIEAQVERGPGDVVSARVSPSPLSPLAPVEGVVSGWDRAGRGKPLIASGLFGRVRREEILAAYGGRALRDPGLVAMDSLRDVGEAVAFLRAAGASGIFLGPVWRRAFKGRGLDSAPRSLKWRWLGRLTPVGEAIAPSLKEAVVAWLAGRRTYKGGERFSAEFAIVTDERAPRRGKAQFSWWCRLPSGAVWDAGCEVLPPLEPLSPRRVRVEFDLPRKAERRLSLRVELWLDGRKAARKEYAVRLLPADYDAPAPVVERIYVFDPKGKVAGALERVNPERIRRLSSLSELPEGAQALIVVGDAPGGAEEVSRLLERGGTVAVIEPSKPPGFLPVRLRLGRFERGILRARIVAPGHPLLDGVRDELLCDWGGVWGALAHRYISRDGRPVGRRDLIVSGTGADPSGMALLTELRLGSGRAVVCCLRLVELFDRDPVAARLLWNIVRYVQRPSPRPARVAVVWEPGGGAKRFERMGLDFDEVSSPEGLTKAAYDLLLVGSGADWGALSGWRDRMREFVEEGGTVLVLLPESPPVADAFLPWPLRSEAVEAGGALKASPGERTLWGVDDLDLSGSFAGLPCFVKVPPHYRPLVVAASASVKGPLGLIGLEPMKGAGRLVECEYGAGRYLLCSGPLDVLWERGREARRVLSAVLANLGVSAKLRAEGLKPTGEGGGRR